MFQGIDYSKFASLLLQYLKPNKRSTIEDFAIQIKKSFIYSEGIEITIGNVIIKNPTADQLSFNTSTPITVRVEGANMLPSAITNAGTGSITYEGLGVVLVNGLLIYEGRDPNPGGITTDDVINNSAAAGLSQTQVNNNFNNSINNLNSSIGDKLETVATDSTINGDGTVGNPLGVNGNIYFTNKIVYFEEEFTPSGVTYQLTAGIDNATFINGSWNVNNILTGSPVDVVSLEGKKLVVGGVLGIGATAIVVDTISASGLVTLNAIPSSNLKIRYCYVLQNTDKLENYKVSDIVSSAEADSDLINSKIAELDSTKADINHTHTESEITDLDKYTQSEIDNFFDGESGGKKQVNWTNVSDKPTSFPPTNHTHVSSQITDFDTAVQNNSAVQANTNKVSADGSVTTHNDVTSAGSGQIITNTERTNLNNQSGVNTGDETTISIQTKRPLKTVEGQSLEGSGNIDITKNDVGLGNVDNVQQIPLSEKGAANGVATLDGTGKVPASQLPVSVENGIRVIGTWNAATNTPDLTSLTLSQGEAYQVSVTGSTNINGETNWRAKDLVVWDDTLTGNWFKIDNTDDVISVNGKTGLVVINKADVGLGNVDNTSDINKPVSNPQQTAINQSITNHEAATNPHPQYLQAGDLPTIFLNPTLVLTSSTVVDLNTAAGVILPFTIVLRATIAGISVSPTGVVTLPQGQYRMSYKANGDNTNNTRKNVGMVIRKNSVQVLPLTASYSYGRNNTDDLFTNALPTVDDIINMNLIGGETFEVFSFQTGSAGVANSIPSECIFTIEKIA